MYQQVDVDFTTLGCAVRGPDAAPETRMRRLTSAGVLSEISLHSWNRGSLKYESADAR